MSAPRVDMHRLQELVRLYRLGTKIRERARLLGMSTRTEQNYRSAIARAGLLEGDPALLPGADELQAAVEAVKPPPPTRRAPTTVDPWLPQIRAALERGAGPQAIWDKLRREDPQCQVTVSAVKRSVKRLQREQGVRAENVVIPVETDPGEVAQVDFGYAGRFFDPASGKVRKAWLFVMVLGYSRHMFAQLVYDQKATTWVKLHVAAFQWFGRVPRTLVPDNLKAAVVRAAFGAGDRHHLCLNRSYRELARHYGCMIDPTPVRAPEKKGKVEASVKYCRRNYLVPGGFQTIDEANAGLPDWLLVTAGMRIHGTTHRRPLDLFAIESEHLLPLPATPYETIEWKRATLHRDTHLEFEGRLYSAPWPYIGQRLWVKATPNSVMIYASQQRLATHSRHAQGRRSTDPSHLPPHRGDLAQRSLAYWNPARRSSGSCGRCLRPQRHRLGQRAVEAA